MMDTTIRLKGRDLHVNFEVEDITLAKRGIGWYELWGARCYDAGVTYLDDFTVTAVALHSERRNTYVEPSPRLLTVITEAIYDDEGIREDLLERGEAEAEAAHNAYHESKLDAITDLRHFCARHGIDFEAAVRTSPMHYEAEEDRAD